MFDILVHAVFIYRLFKNPDTGIFLVCTIIVIFTQFTLLQPVLQFGLFRIPDDWSFLLIYKSLSNLPVFAKVSYIWSHYGLHNSTNALWMGILSYFFDTHYQAFQIINVLVKTLSIILLFPVILITFKSRLLAFLTTIIYGMNSGATGSLFWVMNGNHYAAIALMNIFFISYYYSVSKNSKLLLFVSSFLFFATFLLAPTRMFFLLLLIPIIELFWLLTTMSLRNLQYSTLRLLVLLTPVLIFTSLVSTYIREPMTIQPYLLFNNLMNGNWYLLLYPFTSIGNSILTNDFWRFFGNISENTFSSFSNYLIFIITGPLVTFTVLTIILSRVLSKTPRKFFVLVFCLNLTSEIIMFFISTHHFFIAKDLITEYNPHIFLISKYPTLLAIYIHSVAIGCFLEWRKEQKNLLLLACWVGFLFSTLYIWSMWIFAAPLLISYSSVNHLSYYLIISPIGLALFLSAILSLVFEKSKNRNVLRPFIIFIIIGIIFTLYSTYGSEIKREFMINDPISQPTVKIQDQEKFHDMLASKLGYAGKDGNLLVYFESPDNTLSFYYQRIFATNFFGKYFGETILYRRNSSYGCIGGIFDMDELKVAMAKDSSGFLYEGSCLNRNQLYYGHRDRVFYSLDNFSAFKVEDGELIDIKTDLLKQLQIY